MSEARHTDEPSVSAADAGNDVLARARALLPLIRTHAATAERERRLPAVVARAFARAGLYRIAAPRRTGGSAEDPMTQIQVIATVAEADGSAGWNLMIGVESFGLIAPALDPAFGVFADPGVILSSSTAAVGSAVRVAGGYRINGQWQFVSGCHNADVFAATVVVDDPADPGAATRRMYALVPRAAFDIVDTWHVSGLAGSGSHDVRVTDAVIPADHLVPAMGGGQTLGSAASGRASGTEDRRERALAALPLAPRLAYNKVAVALGIARSAVSEFDALARGKVPRFSSGSLRSRATAQRAMATAEIRVRGAHALLIQETGALWAYAHQGKRPPAADLGAFQAACSLATADLCTAVDLLADAAGTTANFKDHPLDRASRDIRVIRQHASVASHHVEDAGRVLLGLAGEGLMLRGVNAAE
jgi:alkylation response protein AidB-like acyl-CoA dehydrogenase